MSTYNYNSNGSPSPGPGPGNTRPPRNSGDDKIETISWIVDIGLLMLGPFSVVGLFLTIAHALGHDFVGSILRAVRKGANSSNAGGASTRGTMSFDVGQNRTTSSRVYGSAYSSPSQEVRQDAAPAQAADRRRARAEEKAAKQDDGIQHADRGSRAMEIAGWIVGVFGILVTLGAVGGSIWSVLSSLAIVLGGGALIFAGRRARRKEAAFKRCMTVSGNTGLVRIAGLAKTLGLGEEDLEKQLEEMIDRGYYGERAYIDHARGLLVIEPEQMRDVYRVEDEAKAAARNAQKTADEMTAMSEYEKILEQIRQADEDIADETMSEKIRAMRELTAAIFQEVEEHPAKKPQIQRFMNYYLPTTLKLLDSYARIEQQGVSGNNMAKAKADIERIADTLVEGYKKQLDTLYQSEAVDIAGDVSVIENMMRRDGLAGGSDFRIPTDFTPASQAAPAEDKPEGQVLGGH